MLVFVAPLGTTKEKNQLREVIKELFRERDCVTIVRPVADEAELRNIQHVDYEKLRPQFRSQVEAVWGSSDLLDRWNHELLDTNLRRL